MRSVSWLIFSFQFSPHICALSLSLDIFVQITFYLENLSSWSAVNFPYWFGRIHFCFIVFLVIQTETSKIIAFQPLLYSIFVMCVLGAVLWARLYILLCKKVFPCSLWSMNGMEKRFMMLKLFAVSLLNTNKSKLSYKMLGFIWIYLLVIRFFLLLCLLRSPLD